MRSKTGLRRTLVCTHCVADEEEEETKNLHMQTLDSYVMNTLLHTDSKEELSRAVDYIKRIRAMVKAIEPLNRDEISAIEAKLELCQNQENNPDHPQYRRVLEDLEDSEASAGESSHQDESSQEVDQQQLRKRRRTDDSEAPDAVAFT